MGTGECLWLDDYTRINYLKPVFGNWNNWIRFQGIANRLALECIVRGVYV